ncbi:MAG: hypothetical protein FWF08_06630 [Oscillospiraceae bacterium]|nr:hypothetical protein [Oscillospiraceae bacterium]
MKVFNKIKLIPLFLVLCLIFAAGCGNNDKNPENPADTPTAGSDTGASSDIAGADGPANGGNDENTAAVSGADANRTDPANGTSAAPAATDAPASNPGDAAPNDEPDVPEEGVFSFSEIDKIFGPRPVSVNELWTEFGEPVRAYGKVYSVSSGHFCLYADFDGISFELMTNEENKLSFVKAENLNGGENEYPATQQDKKVQIKPYFVTITSENIEFTRFIAIGDTKKDVLDSYEGFKGDERGDNGVTILSYKYRPDEIEQYESGGQFSIDSQTGTVSYYFTGNKLSKITIEWYNGYLAFD